MIVKITVLGHPEIEEIRLDIECYVSRDMISDILNKHKAAVCLEVDDQTYSFANEECFDSLYLLQQGANAVNNAGQDDLTEVILERFDKILEHETGLSYDKCEELHSFMHEFFRSSYKY
jgi:hypothetical protein